MAKVLITSSGGFAYLSGTTSYVPQGDSNFVDEATEVYAQPIVRTGGVYSSLIALVTSNSISVTTTINSRVTSVAGAMTLSITTNSTGEFVDLTNSDTVSSGNTFGVQVSIPAGTGTITIESIGTIFSATTNTVKRLVVSEPTNAGIAFGVTTTTFYSIAGMGDADLTESKTQIKSRIAGTLLNEYIRVSANTSGAGTTFGTRINGVNGNISVSVPSGATGTFEDTVNTDTVSAGDLINNYETYLGVSGSITHRNQTCDFKSTAGEWLNVASEPGLVSLGAGSTTYFALGGNLNGSQNATENNVKLSTNLAHTAKNLGINVSVNGTTAASTCDLRSDNVSTALTISIGAAATGIFEDTTDSVVLTTANKINYRVVVGAGGTVSIDELWCSGVIAAAAILDESFVFSWN